jgi:hypothetical protein
MVSFAADPLPVPEWHQDLEYLTWDRGLDEPLAVDGRQVFLHPTDDAMAMELGEAWSADVAPVWHERVKNLYVSLVERGKHLLGFDGGTQNSAESAAEPVGGRGCCVRRSRGACRQRAFRAFAIAQPNSGRSVGDDTANGRF